MRRSGAQIVWECLLHESVRTVFGIPGGAVIPLYHFLPDYPIRHVLMRHEQAAIHAADAYGRITGRLGVCLTTSGPGATNLVTGLATACQAASPVLVITGQAPTPLLGTDAFQEVDITSITDAVTKHSYLITAGEELPQAIREACYIARSGQPGPVLIAVTADVQRAELDYTYPLQVELPGYHPGQQRGYAAEDGHSNHRPPAGASAGTSGSAIQAVVQQLLKTTRGEIVLVCDPLTPRPDLDCRKPRFLLEPGAMETKGFALPAAIGAQMAMPDEEVWVLTSGEAFQATVQELATVVQENLRLRIAVITGRNSGAVDADNGLPLGPHYVRLAEAYGISALMAGSLPEAKQAIRQAAAWVGPILIDLQIG